jgi:hypothetical protein
MADLSLNFIPFERFTAMTPEQKIDLIIDTTKKKEIVVIEGLLNPGEEMTLITHTMKKIDKKFKGIEICAIPRSELVKDEKKSYFRSFRSYLADVLIGKQRGITIIGPASIVKQIKRDPERIVLKMR